MNSPHPLAGRIVKREKVTRYLLDPTSREGRGKAQFFVGFGFSADDPDALIAALHAHGGAHPITDVWDDRWGRHYEVVGPIRSPDGRDPRVMTAWIRDTNGEIRLVTAYAAP